MISLIFLFGAVIMKVELLILGSEAEYRRAYFDHFIIIKHFLGDIPILFDKKSFDHIFYEPEKENAGGYKFSKRRAKRMLFIKKEGVKYFV